MWACGFAFKPPESLREWSDRADLGIHVRIASQTAFEYQRGSGPEHVVTAHEATVLELFKGTREPSWRERISRCSNSVEPCAALM